VLPLFRRRMRDATVPFEATTRAHLQSMSFSKHSSRHSTAPKVAKGAVERHRGRLDLSVQGGACRLSLRGCSWQLFPGWVTQLGFPDRGSREPDECQFLWHADAESLACLGVLAYCCAFDLCRALKRRQERVAASTCITDFVVHSSNVDPQGGPSSKAFHSEGS
jgi:hypothetical protein